MLEVFIRPEHQNAASMDELALLIGAALYDHYDTFDDFKVSHLGVTDSLETALPDLLKQFRVKGMHVSCESDQLPAIDGQQQNYKIFCLVLLENNSDYVEYHLSYLAKPDESMVEVVAIVDEQFEQLFGKKPVWTKKFPSSYSCKYSLG